MRTALDGRTTDEILAVLDQAGSDPVFLQKGDRDAAVLMSTARYANLQLALRNDFDRLRKEVSEEAKSNGLTGDLLGTILAEIKAER